MNNKPEQTPQKIVDAATNPDNLAILVHAFHGHRQSIREHEESRREQQHG